MKTPQRPSASAFRPTVLLAVACAALGAQVSRAQDHMWSQRFGSTRGDDVSSMAVDPSGYIIVTGRFAETVDFGGGQLTSAGLDDIFVAKYGPNGRHIRSQRFGDTGSDIGMDVVVDGFGNVFVTGKFSGTVDFGGTPLTGGGYFIARFDPNGDHTWSRTFPAWASGLTIDSAGNIILTGRFRGPVDFGGGAIPNGDDEKIFVVKLDSSGNHVWSRRLSYHGSQISEGGKGIAIDRHDNVIITGDIDDSGIEAVFVAKLDPTGAVLWSKEFFAEGGSNSVAVDQAGNVIITGNFSETLDLGGGPLSTKDPENYFEQDIFVAKYDSTGSHLWSQAFGGIHTSCFSRQVAVDEEGNFVITGSFGGNGHSSGVGRFVGTVDFGAGPLTTLGGPDWANIFAATFDPEGDHIWSRSFGDSLADWGAGAALNASGEVVVAGGMRATVDFGGGPLTSAGDADLFIAKFGSTVQVEIEDLQAASANGGVTLEWRLSGDVRESLVGIRVQRADAPEGPYLSRTSLLLQPRGSMMFEESDVEVGRTYWYRLVLLQRDWANEFSLPTSVTVVGPEKWRTELSVVPGLELSDPVTVRYRIAQPVTSVSLSVFDVTGRRIRSIYQGVRNEGEYQHQWNRRDDHEKPVPAGVYLVQLRAGVASISRKLVLLSR